MLNFSKLISIMMSKLIGTLTKNSRQKDRANLGPALQLFAYSFPDSLTDHYNPFTWIGVRLSLQHVPFPI